MQCTVESKDVRADADALLEMSHAANTAVRKGIVEIHTAVYERWVQSKALHQQAKRVGVMAQLILGILLLVLMGVISIFLILWISMVSRLSEIDV